MRAARVRGVLTWSLAAAALVGVQLAVGRSGPLAGSMALGLTLLLGAGLVWLAACVAAAAGRHPALPWILAVALAVRAGALVGDAAASDDPYRYAFEGALVLEGLDPYGPAPADPARVAERARWPRTAAGVNHPEVRAAYPPGMQLGSAAVVFLAGGPEPPERTLFAFRLFHGLCDLACLAPLALLARRRGRPTALAWIAWGWCPTVSLSFAGTGHFDALGILALLCALAAWEGRGRGRAVLGGLLLGLGVLVKFLPVVALAGRAPASTVARRAGATLLVAAAGLLALPPLAGWSSPLGGGLGDYGLRWESSSALLRFVEPLFEPWGPLGADGPLPLGGALDGTWRDPRRLARAVLVALFGATLLLARRRGLDATGVSAVGLLAFALLSPTLHPWYLAWPLAVAAVEPLRASYWLAAGAPLLYFPLAGWAARGEWRELPGLWLVYLLPALALAAFDLLRPPRVPAR